MGTKRDACRFGDAVRGLADAGGNAIFTFPAPAAVKLRELVVSVVNSNVASPNAGLLCRVVAYIGRASGPSNFDSITAATVVTDAKVQGRVVADSDVWAGIVPPARIPLKGIVPAGDALTVEVSQGNNGGAAFNVGASVNVIADDPNDSLSPV